MRYLISVIDDDQTVTQGDPSSVEQEMSAVDAFNHRLRDEGYWVFAEGLASPGSSTMIDNRGETPIITDGPLLESKEFLGGLWIVDAPTPDVARRLATEASNVCNRKVELRPFHAAVS